MERGSMKHLIILIIVISVFGMILYPLFDLAYKKLVTNSEFTYSVYSYIFEPIIFGGLLGTILWVVDKKRK